MFVFADRIEELADGTIRPALVEFDLNSMTVHSLLDEVFSSWTVEYAHTGAEHVPEDAMEFHTSWNRHLSSSSTDDPAKFV